MRRRIAIIMRTTVVYALLLHGCCIDQSLAASSTKPQLQRQCSDAWWKFGSGQCSTVEPVAPTPWWDLRGGVSVTVESAREWHPVLLAFLGTSFGWLMTALGSAAVVIHRLGLPESAYRKVLDFMLGVSGGVMCAASYWSLLAPALEFAELQGWGHLSYVPVALGFLSGGVLLQGTDAWLARMQGSLEELDLYRGLATPAATTKAGDAATPAATANASRLTNLRRLLMLIIAITIHNFPEGMAVGPCARTGTTRLYSSAQMTMRFAAGGMVTFSLASRST